MCIRDRYKAIRLRLKKLSKREITFEDLKQDIKIGDYVNVLITEASPFALKSELI